MDLPRAVFVENVSLRRMAVWFFGLGPDSALARAASPDDWFWDSTHELLAIQAELLDLGNRQYQAVNMKNGAAKPIEIKRPGKLAKEKRNRGTTLGELQQMLGLTVRPKQPAETAPEGE